MMLTGISEIQQAVLQMLNIFNLVLILGLGGHMDIMYMSALMRGKVGHMEITLQKTAKL